jgi:FkbM family methyltransferase
MMERLVANYADVEGLRFASVAIGTQEGTLTFYTVERRPGEPAWADQISSLDRDFVLGHAYALEDLENRIVPIEVESLPLRALVARYELDALDLLHVDAEGLDFEIVGQIPVDAPWAPRFLTFEIKHMGLERWKILKARLRRGGYKFVNVWPDVFAYRTAPERLGHEAGI